MDRSASTTSPVDAEAADTRSMDDSDDSPHRPASRRVASSVYSRPLQHQTSSTHWAVEPLPTTPLERTNSDADPAHGTFHGAESEIDDLMKDLTINQEDDNIGFLSSGANAITHNTVSPIASQASNSPASKDRPLRRDLSDRALLALRSHDATKALCVAINRVSWIDNLQDRLCKMASMIHRDLRRCFHILPITHDTARRIQEVAWDISEVQDSWLEHIIPLQQAVRAMDVVRDTPNLSEIPKEQHGDEIKKFKRMLVPIPTQVGAECNRQIVDLMLQLFREEVQMPFEVSIVEHAPLDPAEMTVKGYLAGLESKFREIHVASIELLMTTATTWDHWKKMGEKIARDANAAQSGWSSHDIKTRTKDALSRVLSLSRKGGTSVPRNSSGQLQISLPLGRVGKNSPRDAVVRNTCLEVPGHPLDARSSLYQPSIRQPSTRQPSSQISASTEWGFIKASLTGASLATRARITASFSDKVLTSSDFIKQPLPTVEVMAQQGEAPEYYHNNMEHGQRYGNRGYQDQGYLQNGPQYGIDQNHGHLELGYRQCGYQQHGYGKLGHHERVLHERNHRQDSHQQHGYLERDHRQNEYGQNYYRENHHREGQQREHGHREQELRPQNDALEYYHNQPQRPESSHSGGLTWEEVQKHGQAMNYDGHDSDGRVSFHKEELRARPADPLDTDNELNLTRPGCVNGYWNPALDNPADRPSMAQPVTTSSDGSVILIDDGAYYDELKEFYESNPPRPNADDDYEYTAHWYRAMALRRLEGGPPIAPVGGYVPTPATVRIQQLHAVEEKEHQADKERVVLRKASQRGG